MASLLLLVSPLAAQAQDSKAALDAVAKAIGADRLTSLEYSGTGHVWAVGQSGVPGAAWPKFGATFTRAVNYDTAVLRDQLTRTQVDPPRGGGNVRGQLRSTFFLRGDHAWNLVGDAAVPAPVALVERTFQRTAPHGIVKAALAGKGGMSGRRITVAVPGRFKAETLVNAQNQIEKVNGTIAHAVLGDRVQGLRRRAVPDEDQADGRPAGMRASISRLATCRRTRRSTSPCPRPSSRRPIRTRAWRARWWPTACGASRAARITAS